MTYSWYIHLTTKDVVPESLELFALQQKLCIKITNHVVGPAVFNLRIAILHLIDYIKK
jgi:hypothetical protein